MNWKGQNVLVTGAGGFIGSHLAERLVEEGASVRALVRYNGAGTRGWLDHSPLADHMDIALGDLADSDFVRGLMQGVHTVFHLGALIAIPYSYHAPRSYVRVNIEGTLNVLQAARDLGTQRVLHTSTSEVYGTAITVPISESHPLQGQSPYSASKIGADKIAESYFLSFGTPVCIVRPFNTFGPRQSARAVIPTIMSQLLAGRTQVKLGSLTPTRDLNFVSNTVEGFLAAGSHPEAIGQTFNFGSNREISIGDLAQLIAQICNRPIEIITEEQRLRPENSEVERLLADSSKAMRTLNWSPRVSLEEGLAQTRDWMEKHIHHYRPDTYAV